MPTSRAQERIVERPRFGHRTLQLGLQLGSTFAADRVTLRKNANREYDLVFASHGHSRNGSMSTPHTFSLEPDDTYRTIVDPYSTVESQGRGVSLASMSIPEAVRHLPDLQAIMLLAGVRRSYDQAIKDWKLGGDRITEFDHFVHEELVRRAVTLQLRDVPHTDGTTPTAPIEIDFTDGRFPLIAALLGVEIANPNLLQDKGSMNLVVVPGDELSAEYLQQQVFEQMDLTPRSYDGVLEIIGGAKGLEGDAMKPYMAHIRRFIARQLKEKRLLLALGATNSGVMAVAAEAAHGIGLRKRRILGAVPGMPSLFPGVQREFTADDYPVAATRTNQTIAVDKGAYGDETRVLVTSAQAAANGKASEGIFINGGLFSLREATLWMREAPADSVLIVLEDAGRGSKWLSAFMRDSGDKVSSAEELKKMFPDDAELNKAGMTEAVEAMVEAAKTYKARKGKIRVVSAEDLDNLRV